MRSLILSIIMFVGLAGCGANLDSVSGNATLVNGTVGGSVTVDTPFGPLTYSGPTASPSPSPSASPSPSPATSPVTEGSLVPPASGPPGPPAGPPNGGLVPAVPTWPVE